MCDCEADEAAYVILTLGQKAVLLVKKGGIAAAFYIELKLLILIAEHQDAADGVNKQQSADLEAGGDGLAILQLVAVGDGHGDTPCQREDIQTHNNSADDHQDLSGSGQTRGGIGLLVGLLVGLLIGLLIRLLIGLLIGLLIRLLLIGLLIALLGGRVGLLLGLCLLFGCCAAGGAEHGVVTQLSAAVFAEFHIFSPLNKFTIWSSRICNYTLNYNIF